MKRDDERLTHYARHMVPLLVYEKSIQLNGDYRYHAWNGSGFVAQVGNSSWIFTAGHVVEAIITAHANERLSHIYACDTWMCHDGTGTPVPVPIDPRNWVLIGTFENPPDLGAIRLDNNTMDLLRLGKIDPVPETDWQTLPDKFDFYQVLGSPGELISIVDENGQLPAKISVGRGLIHTTKIDRPSYVKAYPLSRFYGQLKNSDTIPNAPNIKLKTIEGVSGGPILGCNKVAGGLYYWVVGIQSGWIASEKIIIADYGNTLFEHLLHLEC